MGCSSSAAKQAAPQLQPQPLPSPAAKSQQDASLAAFCRSPSINGPCSPSVGDLKGNIVVLGKYRMGLSEEDIMGEGTSSICRKGTDIATGEPVAIKVYKASSKTAIVLKKFRRQVQVLSELQEPFVKCEDPALWHESLASAKPSHLFVTLLDYSKDAKGEPAPDPTDQKMYVVTELAQYSLKDFIAQRRSQKRPVPVDLVKKIARSIIHVLAGLHAKGLVHLDLKPENLMMFQGRLKLIDVDGCVRTGSIVSVSDSSISFSPCYCSPEWARFLVQESDGPVFITIQPALDVWSVGMTICELATLDAVLKPTYAKFLRNGNSHREAGFSFMDYLSDIQAPPIPKRIEKFDVNLYNFLVNNLLVCDDRKRKTCAETLTDPYICSDPTGKVGEVGLPLTRATSDSRVTDGDDLPIVKRLGEDRTAGEPILKGVLWKLNNGENPKDNTQWLKRDIWISRDGSLCYFSVTTSRRLIIADTKQLLNSEINPVLDPPKPFSFEIRMKNDSAPEDIILFACDSEQELGTWVEQLKDAPTMHHLPTMKLGDDLAKDLVTFKLTVKNRRIRVDEDAKDQFAPVHKGHLWKVKAEGDRMKKDDWFEREMWIAVNGSFVYWSKKEERDLVYYTAEDLANASYAKVSDSESFRPWTFQVRLPAKNGVEFSPGEFAALSEDELEHWLTAFRTCTIKS